MVVDPGDWLPIMGLLFVGGCTAVAIAGAWAIGRSRGMQDALKRNDQFAETRERVERMERTLHAVAEEIERLGEVQRFALKLIGDRVSELETDATPPVLPAGRVITPH